MSKGQHVLSFVACLNNCVCCHATEPFPPSKSALRMISEEPLNSSTIEDPVISNVS